MGKGERSGNEMKTSRGALELHSLFITAIHRTRRIHAPKKTINLTSVRKEKERDKKRGTLHTRTLTDALRRQNRLCDWRSLPSFFFTTLPSPPSLSLSPSRSVFFFLLPRNGVRLTFAHLLTACISSRRARPCDSTLSNNRTFQNQW